VLKGKTGIRLKWHEPETDGGQNITAYFAQMCIADGSWSDLPISYSGDLLTGSMIASVDRLVAQQPLQFRICAHGASGNSEYSEASNCIVLPGSEPQELDAAPHATTQSSASIRLEWNPPAYDGGLAILKYELAYAINGEGAESCDLTLCKVQTDQLSASIDVQPMQPYQYCVRAVNALGASAWSPMSNPVVVRGDVPGNVCNLRAEAGIRSVRVDWSIPESDNAVPIEQYQIDARKVLPSHMSAEAGWTSQFINSGEATTFLFQKLSCKEVYQFRVRASNQLGWGAFEICKTSVQPHGQPASEVQNLRAEPTGTGFVRLMWEAPQDDGGLDVTAWEVWKSIAASGEWSVHQHIQCTEHTSEYSHLVAIEADQLLTFRIAAVNAVGVGNLCRESEAVLDGGMTPDAPTNVSASAINPRWVLVQWHRSQVDGGLQVTECSVDFCAGARATQWLHCATVAPEQSKAFVAVPLTNEQYTFRVRARNAAGWSDWSVPSVPLRVEQTIRVLMPNLAHSMTKASISVHTTLEAQPNASWLNFMMPTLQNASSAANLPVTLCVQQLIDCTASQQLAGLSGPGAMWRSLRVKTSHGTADVVMEGYARRVLLECFASVADSNTFLRPEHCNEVYWGSAVVVESIDTQMLMEKAFREGLVERPVRMVTSTVSSELCSSNETDLAKRCFELEWPDFDDTDLLPNTAADVVIPLVYVVQYRRIHNDVALPDLVPVAYKAFLLLRIVDQCAALSLLDTNMSFAASCRYTVQVHTADQTFAGTDAKVWIIIFGSLRVHGPIQLQADLSDTSTGFNRGQCCVCYFELPNVGSILYARLGLSGAAEQPYWLPSLLKISVDDGEAVTFTINSWLSEKLNQAEKMYRASQGLSVSLDLLPDGGTAVLKSKLPQGLQHLFNTIESIDERHEVQQLKLVTYHIQIVAGGSMPDDQFGAQATAVLYGDSRFAEVICLSEGHNRFSNGCLDLTAELPDLGELYRVHIFDRGVVADHVHTVLIQSTFKQWTFKRSKDVEQFTECARQLASVCMTHHLIILNVSLVVARSSDAVYREQFLS
jgi:hypothetical protein